MTDDWRKDMGRCELNDGGLCLANIPAACLCRQMSELTARRCLENLWRALAEHESDCASRQGGECDCLADRFQNGPPLERKP